MPDGSTFKYRTECNGKDYTFLDSHGKPQDAKVEQTYDRDGKWIKRAQTEN